MNIENDKKLEEENENILAEDPCNDCCIFTIGFLGLISLFLIIFNFIIIFI